MLEQLKDLSRKIRAPFHKRWAYNRLKEYRSKTRDLDDVVNWGLGFGGSGYYKIRAMQVRSEINALAKKVQALQPRKILEIGTDRAGTLLIWSALASEEVITCDIRDLERQKELFTQLTPPKSNCRIKILSGNSHTPEFKQMVADALNGDKVDFLFIDGDHTEKGVEADYNDYQEFVRPGGLIAFHDIVDRQPYPTNQVQHFWKRLKGQADTEEIVNDYNQVGCGIGVVHVK